MGAETLDSDFFDPDFEHSSQDICEGQEAFDWTGKEYEDEYENPEEDEEEISEDVGQRKKSMPLDVAFQDYNTWKEHRRCAFYVPPPVDNLYYIAGQKRLGRFRRILESWSSNKKKDSN